MSFTRILITEYLADKKRANNFSLNEKSRKFVLSSHERNVICNGTFTEKFNAHHAATTENYDW
jgi:hypothetical protein